MTLPHEQRGGVWGGGERWRREEATRQRVSEVARTKSGNGGFAIREIPRSSEHHDHFLRKKSRTPGRRFWAAAASSERRGREDTCSPGQRRRRRTPNHPHSPPTTPVRLGPRFSSEHAVALPLRALATGKRFWQRGARSPQSFNYSSVRLTVH